MKAFIVVSCLILAATAKPQGYTYDKPATDGLSVTLLLPPSQNQHIPSSFPALSTTQYSNNHLASHQGFAPVSSHQSLGVSSHSSGGSLSLGSSYAVSPTVNTFSGHSFGGNSFGSGVSSGHSFGSGASNSFNGNSFGSGSSFSGVASQAPSSSYAPVASSPSFVSSPAAPAPSFAPAPVASAPSFAPAPVASAPSFVASPVAPAPSFAPAPVASAPSFVSSPVAPVTNTLVQKHIYVHVPPPDEDEFAQPHHAVAPVQAQKHYKIIFIKAPSGPSVAQQLAQAQLAQQQSEEKTLVYVLVKKPESLAELQNAIPRAPLPQPSKPEVYFIKYKAQTDGGSAPVPVSQPIGLSAPLATAPTPDFQELAQSNSFGSASSVSSTVGAVDSTAQTLGSSSTSSFDGSSSSSSFDGSSSSSSFDGSSLSSSDASNIAAVIQPRTPAPEYGPPKQ